MRNGKNWFIWWYSYTVTAQQLTEITVSKAPDFLKKTVENIKQKFFESI